MQRNASAILAGVAAAAIGAPSQAELIGLELDDFPDIASFFIDVTYDATVPGANGQLEASGFAIQYDPDGGPMGDPITNGVFQMIININKLTGEADSGNVVVGGNIANGGFGPTLVTGDLVDFGFNEGGMIMDVLFTLTGGDLASDWGGAGQEFGVILDVGVNYTGDFTQSFDNLIKGIPGSGAGSSDTATVTTVPVPSAMALLVCAGVCGRRRRRAA